MEIARDYRKLAIQYIKVFKETQKLEFENEELRQKLLSPSAPVSHPNGSTLTLKPEKVSYIQGLTSFDFKTYKESVPDDVYKKQMNEYYEALMADPNIQKYANKIRDIQHFLPFELETYRTRPDFPHFIETRNNYNERLRQARLQGFPINPDFMSKSDDEKFQLIDNYRDEIRKMDIIQRVYQFDKQNEHQLRSNQTLLNQYYERAKVLECKIAALQERNPGVHNKKLDPTDYAERIDREYKSQFETDECPRPRRR